MNLEQLRSVQSAERQQSGLQSLRESFYEEAGEYVGELKTRRQRAADRADDPFSDPEVGRLTDEIETAEEVIEAIYERRMGKVLKRASLAAAEMSVDEEGLTAEERRLFHELVERIRENKAAVLDTAAGEVDDRDPVPGRDPDPTADAGPGTADGVSAADAMGGGGDGASGGPTSDSRSDAAGTDGVREVDPDPAPPGSDGPERDPSGDGADTEDADAGGTAPIPGGGAPSGGAERVTVRITSDVDEFYGVDERRYDLDAEDVVQLPEANAKPLLQKEAAERLD